MRWIWVATLCACSAPVTASRTFGKDCSSDPVCGTSEICSEFGNIGKRCTLTCTASSDCPSGERGTFCNRRNVCRP